MINPIETLPKLEGNMTGYKLDLLKERQIEHCHIQIEDYGMMINTYKTLLCHVEGYGAITTIPYSYKEYQRSVEEFLAHRKELRAMKQDLALPMTDAQRLSLAEFMDKFQGTNIDFDEKGNAYTFDDGFIDKTYGKVTRKEFGNKPVEGESLEDFDKKLLAQTLRFLDRLHDCFTNILKKTGADR